MHHSLSRLAAAMAASLPLLALAQGRVDPADPRAPTRPLAHRSAFADYRAFLDLAPGDWRRLNDTVGRAALHPMATAPEAAPPVAAPGTPAAPAGSAGSAPLAPPAHQPMHTMPGHPHHPPGGHR
ncbi:hypothetical protein AACH06_02835 [Ideonella sp. DXS29W]|uniref:DUF3613 domain-containing protein n=1 Tax=Ideonella lacteola TaxID=2984193 RepID=A0ABU9BLD1_9BURK